MPIGVSPRVARPPRSTLLALLRDARENPKDLTPRLIMADWLEDHGDAHDAARAELIRLQCHLERKGLPEAERSRLWEQESELFRAHGKTWLGPLAGQVSRAEFRRGLLRLTLQPSRLLTRGGMTLTASEAFAWVEELWLEKLSPAGLCRLLASRILNGIPILRLPHARGRAEIAARLADSPRLSGLRELDLHGCWIGVDGARSLAASPHASNLLTLGLDFNGLGEEGVRALLTSPNLVGLERLRLEGNNLGPTGAAVVIEAGLPERLRFLSLHYNELGDAGVMQLARLSQLARLEALSLGHNRIGAAGVKALVESPHLESLNWLGLASNPFGDAERELLRRRFGDRVRC